MTAATIHLDYDQERELRFLIGLAGTAGLALMNLAAQLIALSSEVESMIVGALLAAGAVFIASLGRLVKLATAIIELRLRKKFLEISTEMGIDPAEAERLADDL